MKSARKKVLGLIIIVSVLMAAYTVSFSAVSLIRYRSFSFHDMDLAVINQNIYNASQGVLVSPEYGIPGFLSGHKWFIIFLLLPLYVLFPGPPLLLVLQSAALALGAGAVFLLARKMLNPRLGLAMAFAYLLYPALQFVNLFEFHPIAFATPLLLFAFYYLQSRRWGWYLVFVALSLSVREDVPIAVFALGVYALIIAGRDQTANFWRRWRWGLVPLISALIWFYVCESLIPRLVAVPTPVRSPEMVESFFGWLGASPVQIISTLVTRPGYVLSGVLTTSKLAYIWQLLSPVSLLPLFSPAGLVMVLLSMTEGLLSERFTHFSIHYQYSSIITPMVFASAVLGLRNLMKWRPLRAQGNYLAAAIVLISLLTAWSFGPIPRLTQQFAGWRFTDEDAVRQTMVKSIPPDLPVLATFEFTPKLSSRPQMFYFYHLYASSRRPDWAGHIPVMQERADYVLVDFNDWLTFYDFYTPGGDGAVYDFLQAGKWELETMVNSLALFSRGERFVAGVVEAAEAGAGTFRAVEAIPGLEVGPAAAEVGEELGFPVLRFAVDLQARAPVGDLLLAVRLVNRLTAGEFLQQFLLAPYRVYPTQRWRPGETVRVRANILLPEDLPSGNWDLQLFGLVKKKGLGLPPEAATAFYRHFDTAMALNYLPRRWGVSPDQMLDQHLILYLPGALSRP